MSSAQGPSESGGLLFRCPSCDAMRLSINYERFCNIRRAAACCRRCGYEAMVGRDDLDGHVIFKSSPSKTYFLVHGEGQ